MSEYEYRRSQIASIVQETPTIRTFKSRMKVDFEPGQFVMVWLPEIDEKPFSIAAGDPLSITVKKVGRFTGELFDLEVGDYIWLRGPYGRGFPLTNFSGKKICLVGGGIGSVPLIALGECLKKNIESIYIGATTRKEILFRDRFENIGPLKISTDDGTEGFEGTIAELLTNEELLQKAIYCVCGNERMMISVIDVVQGKGIPEENIFLSVERYFKCGIGACGYCCLDDLIVCTDGPVFSYPQLRHSQEFGKFRRDKTGTLTEI